jgi:hypothetical protein
MKSLVVRGALAGALIVASLFSPGIAGAGSVAAAASSYGFGAPMAVASVGGHLWIANYSADSVTETTTTGVWVRTIRGVKYGFARPDAVLGYAGNVYVVSRQGLVTEINASTAALVRRVEGVGYHFSSPVAAVEQSGNIWVVNSGSNSLSEFRASTGAAMRTLDNTHDVRYRFDAPAAIAVEGANLWIANKRGGSTTDPNAGAVTEISASTGAFIRRVATHADGLERPSGIAFDGTHLWISDAAASAVTELDAAGRLIRVITNSSMNDNYGFDAPTVVLRLRRPHGRRRQRRRDLRRQPTRRQPDGDPDQRCHRRGQLVRMQHQPADARLREPDRPRHRPWPRLGRQPRQQHAHRTLPRAQRQPDRPLPLGDAAIRTSNPLRALIAAQITAVIGIRLSATERDLCDLR